MPQQYVADDRRLLQAKTLSLGTFNEVDLENNVRAAAFQLPVGSLGGDGSSRRAWMGGREFYLEEVEPYAGKDWTDTRRNRDRRAQLKQRAVGEGRPVPCPPELTRMLHEHIRLFGTAADGRLFVGERNGEELPNLTIVRAWQRARTAVFTEEVIASPLAATPYDLRYAAVSTWLNGGVPAVTVADWAGHSVEVLAAITRSGH